MSIETTIRHIDICEMPAEGVIGGVPYWKDVDRVVINYADLCNSVHDSLAHQGQDNDQINVHFDRTLVARLNEYFLRDFPDENLPPHLVLRVEGVQNTPWLGGFRLIQERYLQTQLYMPKGMFSQEDAPRLTFETADGMQMLSNESPENVNWWERHGQSMGLSYLNQKMASLAIKSSAPVQ